MSDVNIDMEKGMLLSVTSWDVNCVNKGCDFVTVFDDTPYEPWDDLVKMGWTTITIGISRRWLCPACSETVNHPQTALEKRGRGGYN